MRILLTGATGFLGRAVLRRLAAREVVVALHRPGSRPESIDGVQWFAQDLAAPLAGDLPDRLDAVVHLAQSRQYRTFPEGAVDVFEVNAAATVRLLDYGRRAGATTFVHASSGAVYAPGREPVRESDAPSPSGFYAASKLAAEHALEHFRALMTAHALRFFFIYGPGQRDTFVPGLLARIVERRDVALAGRDGIRVNPVYVDDAADVVVASLGHGQSVTVNVAGPDVVSIRAIAELGGRLLDVEPRFAVADAQPDLVASTERQYELFGTPSVGFEEGLRRTVVSGDWPARDSPPQPQ